jgi:hypothetical protein
MSKGPTRREREIRQDQMRANRGRPTGVLSARPDLPALWALVLAVLMIVLTAVSAQASSGGISGNPGSSGGAEAARLGDRVLRVGMTGADVMVLNGIVRSKAYGRAVGISPQFETTTAGAVRAFQRRKELAATGVVNRLTARELTRSMRIAGATWYGPGFYGNRTACGQVLRRGTVGVAHKTLPCGAKVTISYRGRALVTKVIDRGPYRAGYSWDLTNGARELLHFDYSDKVRYAVAR